MTSPHAPRRLVIATRESALALSQARHVQTRLQALYPRAIVDLLVTSQGARGSDRSSPNGGHVHAKDLEAALADGRADVFAHALEDVPLRVSDGFVLAAIEARDDAREALVSMRHASLAALPADAIVACAGACCELQLRGRFPALDVRRYAIGSGDPVRELREGRFHAMVLPVADARFLGLGDLVCELIDPAELLPAPGQGVLAVECRADRGDVVAALAPLNDTATELAALAERGFAHALAGGRNTPLAAHAEWQEGSLWLRGLIGTRDGTHVIRGEQEQEIVDAAAAVALGTALADELLAHGAGRLLVDD
jgi:hydroxymethylbilane synthase